MSGSLVSEPATDHDWAALVAALEPEFRNPLRAVLSSADALLDVYSEQQRRELIAAVKDAARLLQRTAGALCDAAAASQSPLPLKDERVPLRSALLEAVVVARHALAAPATRVLVEATVPEQIVVPVDRRRLVDLVAGMLIAAEQPLADDHRLRISARAAPGGPVEIAFVPAGADTSVLRLPWRALLDPPPLGTTWAARKHLNAISTRALLRRLGGTLVHSDVPLAATVRLPLVPLCCSASITHPLPGHLRVLVVHAAGRSQAPLVQDLAAHRADVEEASDYDAAFEALRRSLPAVIVLEQIPNDQAALQFARHVRRLPSCSRTPILLISHELSHDALEAARRYTSAVLLSPTGADAVRRVLGGLLAPERRTTPRLAEIW
jgi:hypothetical protein